MWAGVRRESVDGVETFWAEGQGPATATLTFRVGVVDETLYLKGITHMVEHLALQRLGLQRYSYNGFVDHLRTSFTATGEPEELATFLRDVCDALTDLPLDRLEHERQILLTEAANHLPGVIDGMLALRYGPRGPGLAGQTEMGLHHVGAERVRIWAREHFRPENAVLWLTVPPPEGLTLPLAPGGERHPVAETEPLPVKLPGWVEQGDRGLVFSSTHPRSIAAAALPQMIERRLQERLRYDRGIAYEVGATYFGISAGTAFSAIWTDVMKDNAVAARDVMLATLDDFATEGPTDEEVDRHKEAVQKLYADPFTIAARLDHTTQAYLIDPSKADRDTVAETMALTPGEVRDAARAAAAGAVYALPEGATMPGGYEPVPLWSEAGVSGKTFTPTSGSAAQLVLGDEGITLTDGKSRRVTIRFDDCEAMAQWDDGTRVLYGSDGFAIQVRPGAWNREAKIRSTLDERLTDRSVRMKGSSGSESAPVRTRRPTYLRLSIVAGVLSLGAFANLVAPDPGQENAVVNGSGFVLFLVLALAALWKHSRT